GHERAMFRLERPEPATNVWRSAVPPKPIRPGRIRSYFPVWQRLDHRSNILVRCERAGTSTRQQDDRKRRSRPMFATSLPESRIAEREPIHEPGSLPIAIGEFGQ